MKLSAKKNGKGYITSYNLIIGSKEARELNFIDSDGNSKELEKFIDTEKKELLVKIK